MRIVGLIAMGLLLSGAAFAEEPRSEPTTPEMVEFFSAGKPLPEGALNFEYGVPATPALAIIGASGDAIPTTANLQRFAASIVDAAEDAGGGAAYGLDFSPHWTWSGPMSLHDYIAKDRWSRALARSRVSMAFAEGDSESEVASRASIGFATSLLTSSDPAIVGENGTPHFSECALGVLRGAPAQQRRQEKGAIDLERANGVISGTAAAQRDALSKQTFISTAGSEIKKCRDEAIELARRGRALDIGLAAQWRGEPGALENLDGAGATLWATYLSRQIGDESAGSTNFFRAVGHVRFDFATKELDGDTLVEFDRHSVSVGLEQVAPRYLLSVQASYESSDGPVGTRWDGEASRYLARGEFQVGDGVWLSATAGSVDRSDSDEDENYVSIALRFKAPERAATFDSASWNPSVVSKPGGAE